MTRPRTPPPAARCTLIENCPLERRRFRVRRKNQNPRETSRTNQPTPRPQPRDPITARMYAPHCVVYVVYVVYVLCNINIYRMYRTRIVLHMFVSDSSLLCLRPQAHRRHLRTRVKVRAMRAARRGR